MFWYILLFVLGCIFAGLSVTALALWILSMCEIWELLLIVVITGLISFGLLFGANALNENVSVTTTEVVQMEVVKLDLTEMGSGGITTKHYYMSVTGSAGKNFILDITPEEYVEHNIGDIVEVKITTKTTFGETTQYGELK